MKIKVKVEHHRVPDNGINHLIKTGPAKRTKPYSRRLGCFVDLLSNKHYGPLERGGATVVKLKLEDGPIILGLSICSMKDQFEYKEGVRLALERALLSLHNHLIATNGDYWDTITRNTGEIVKKTGVPMRVVVNLD